MAQNYAYLNEEELKEKIFMIADYIIENKASTIKTANYATEHDFPISYVSVHYLMCNKLKLYDKERYEKVMEIFQKNQPKGVEDAKVMARVYSAVSLLLQDFNVEEIARELNSTKDTIYDDLTNRLPKINPEMSVSVQQKLQEHRLNNLKSKNPASEVENQIAQIVEEGVKNLTNIQNIGTITSKPRKKASDLSSKIKEEIILMALTYRISYKNLGLLLKMDPTDLKNTFELLDNYSFPLYYLNLETRDEDEINERVAYIKGYNYLKTRKKLLNALNAAKKSNNQEQIAKIKLAIKEHFHLIDDYVVQNTMDTPLSELTQEQKDALARYRLKYALPKRDAIKILKRGKLTLLDEWELDLGQRDQIFKEKIDFLEDYNQAKLNEYIKKTSGR